MRTLRTTARVTTAVGAVGSVAITLVAGHRNPSILLMGMFAAWVLLPFVALAWADRLSGSWPRPAQVRLAVLMLLESAASVGVYAFIAFGSTHVKLAAPFLLLPPILLALVAGAFVSGHSSRGRARPN